MTSFENRIPAGWYPDQNMVNTERYWDGNAWTEHLRPAGGGAPPAEGFQQPQFNPPQPQPLAPAPVPVAVPAKGGGTAWKIVLGIIVGLFVLMLGGCTLLLFIGREVAVETSRIADEEFAEEFAELAETLEEDGIVIGEDQPNQPGQPGSTEDPLPYEQEATLRFETFGDADGSVWSTTIGTPRDITEEVLAENPFNEPPPDGVLYVGFDVTMTLLEADKEPLSTGFNFSWELLGGQTNAVYDSSTIETETFGCGVVGGDFDTFAEVFVGGTVAGTVCIPLPEADLTNPDTRVAIHFVDDSRAVFGP